jgi:hypothetical protein
MDAGSGGGLSANPVGVRLDCDALLRSGWLGSGTELPMGGGGVLGSGATGGGNWGADEVGISGSSGRLGGISGSDGGIGVLCGGGGLTAGGAYCAAACCE